MVNFKFARLARSPFVLTEHMTSYIDSELSKIDKFNYLRSMVTYWALEAISGLTLTSANYDEAIEILKLRFGNKQLIINQHMEQLLSVEGVTSQRDVKGLRHLYDVIESNVRSLRSLGVSADSYGSLLSSVLMNKLPPELRLIVTRKFGGTDSLDFSVLLKVIEEEVQVREQSRLKIVDDPGNYPQVLHSWLALHCSVGFVSFELRVDLLWLRLLLGLYHWNDTERI